MQYFIVAIFVLTFLAGVVTMQLNKSTDGRSGLVSDLLSIVGVSQREKNNKLQQANIVATVKEQVDQSKERMSDLTRTQQLFMENSLEQQRSLVDTQAKVQDLSAKVNEYADQFKQNWFAIKEVASDLKNQTGLLIDDANEKAFALQAVRDIKSRSEFFNKSARAMQNIDEQAQRFKDRVHDLENSLIQKDDVLIKVALKDLQDKSARLLADTKVKMNRFQELNQQYRVDALLSNERTQDFIEQNSRQVKDNQEIMRDRKRQRDDFIRDQTERLKEQRLH